jgi:5-oxoprolinase (ATP-hydrolysing) subunit A
MATARPNAKLAINCDMGESCGLYKIGDDEDLMPLITIANVTFG